MFVLGISLFISSMAIAKPNHGDPTDCDQYIGTDAYNDCDAYCFAKNCASDDPQGNPRACANNKANFAELTGEEWMPCDVIACALCADPDPCNQQGTAGICENIKAVDCAAIDGSNDYGEYPCDVITIPADVAPGCSQIPPQWGLIPDCQYTGPAFVCNFFIGGVLVDKCPAPVSCYFDCEEDSDCISDDYTCVDGACALPPASECP